MLRIVKRFFPKEVIELFGELGIDYRKEIEITTWEILPNKPYHIGGWFHFKGNFSIVFPEGNALTFF